MNVCQRPGCFHPMGVHSPLGVLEEDGRERGGCRVSGCRCVEYTEAPKPPPEDDRVLKVELPEGYSGKVSIEFWPASADTLPAIEDQVRELHLKEERGGDAS